MILWQEVNWKRSTRKLRKQEKIFTIVIFMLRIYFCMMVEV